MSTDTLLIELRTEELPPKALNSLGESLANSIVEQLIKAKFIDDNASYTAFASPRRLAVEIADVLAIQEDQQMTRKGPSTKAGMKDGQPTKALEGFARSCGTEVSNLKIINDGKQDIYAYEFVQAGQSLSAIIGDILAQAVKKLPIPKVMRWGSSTHTFVRPVHGLVIMHGSELVDGEVLGLTSQNWTLGHRFLSENKITFNHANEYENKMAEEGKVIANFAKRKNLILTDLTAKANALHATCAMDEDLLNEVTALVEMPAVLEAGFEEHFLAVPQECLILTMQQNQKYFPLLDANGQLMNRFLLVSNLKIADSSNIIQGNERVLRARLADAEFFFEQDKKHSLESRLPKLANVVYHNKIGSQEERIARLVTISEFIANHIGADINSTKRAATLAKADLVTDMVGEFPELQGTMGKYYAQHDGEADIVAQAIEEHYQPRFAGDALPSCQVATAVALADKLEAIVGIWGIGLIPTGDKDPYALRRASLGVLRMLMQYDLNLHELLSFTFKSFADGLLNEKTVNEVADFMQARLAVLLNQNFEQDVVAAVLAKRPQTLNDLTAKLQAVQNFKALPEASALAAANKRVHNLLKKADAELSAVKPELLTQAEEKALFGAIESTTPHINKALAEENFTQALSELAGLKNIVDQFFDDVMVMADDAQVKQNRLNLLAKLAGLFNAVADISTLND